MQKRGEPSGALTLQLERLRETSRLLDSLTVFAAGPATKTQAQLARDVDAALTRSLEAIIKQADEAIEEREVDQEDWDSSSNIHLLHNLRRKAERLLAAGLR